jgi:cell division protein FtsW (lipid II flippase)
MKTTNVKAEKMRYQNNSSAYWLVMLSTVLSVVALFTVITYDTFGIEADAIHVIPDFRIALEIGVGIVMLLSMFLAAEKVKYYDRIWSYIGLPVLATVSFLRIFNIPFYVREQNWIPEATFTMVILEFAASAILLVIAAIVSIRKVTILKNLSKELNLYGTDGTK